MKKMKRIAVLLIALIMAVSGAVLPTTVFADDVEMVYLTVEMPFADFYFGELQNVEPKPVAETAKLNVEDPVEAAGYRAEGMYDSYTSATTFMKAGTQIPMIKRETVTVESNPRLVYTAEMDVAIAVPKVLYDSILEAQEQNKECSNEVLSFFDKNTALLTEVPKEYKVMMADGSFSKMVTESAVDEDATAVIDAYSPAGKYSNAFGENIVTVSGVDMDILGDEQYLMGEILIDDDGNRYGLKPFVNWYRLAQANLIAFDVSDGFVGYRAKENVTRPYKYTAPLVGKKIKKIQFMLKGIPDIVVETDLLVKKQLSDPYDADMVSNAVRAADVQYNKDSMTTDVTFQGLPEGYDKNLAELVGPDGDILEKAAFDKTTGKLTITQDKSSSVKPGTYRATFRDDEFIDVSAKFKVQSGAAEDFAEIRDNKLVVKDERYTLDDYKNVMNSVKVNDNEVKGSSLNPDLFFDEEGFINFDAKRTVNGKTTVFFPNVGEEYKIVVKADGYPDMSFTVTRPGYTDGFYTTVVNSDKESYGWSLDKEGKVVYGFSYPKNNYDFPVTIQIKDGKIVDVAYTQNVVDLVANTSSDINYLMWAMDGHNVTEQSYNYLAGPGRNYEKYHLDPMPPMNGVGMREQIIAKNGTEGVDTVTAASITSRAIINSVNQSLSKALKGKKDDPAPDLPQPDTTPDVIPVDGVYMAKDVACIGASIDSEVAPLILTVKDRKMSAQMAVEQRQSSYPYIYAGTESEALAAGEEGWLYPVDYDYGYKYPGSIFRDVPIKSLDKKNNFVMFASGSGNWFNRLITIKSEDLVKIPYGNYAANSFDAGKADGSESKTTITCEKILVRRDGIMCEIAFSSSKYTEVEIDGVKYAPEVRDGKSVFTVPLNINGQTLFKGTTVAMSSPQTIEYKCTITFDYKDLKPIARTYKDGFYTTTVNTNKERYGYQIGEDSKITYGMSNPKSNYDFPVTIQIKDGKIADVAYTKPVLDIVANTSSDINYLMWAMDGHDVTDKSYNYLAGKGRNYEKYNINPFPPKNGKGLKDQIIEANGTNDVDTVTAATITSLAIIDSVDKSLEKAEKGQKDDPDPDLPKPDTTPDVIPDDGVYLVNDVACIGASVDTDVAPMILYVEDKKIVSDMGIEARQTSYPQMFAGTEKEALAAGETAWLYPADYDYGYKYPGSMYKNVPIKSLDKALNFVIFASGSGNWFNRQFTIKTDDIVNIPQNNDDWKYSADSFKAVQDAFAAFIKVRDTEGSKADDITAAKNALVSALAGLKPHVHDYKPVLGSDKAPTCTEDGKEIDKECSECHDKVVGAKIDKLGHNYQTVLGSDKAPTCTEDGKEVDKECSRCHDKIEGAKIDKLGHDLVVTKAKKATDKAAGNIAYWTCSRCEKIFSDEAGTKEITKAKTVIPKNNMTVKAKTLKAKANKKMTFAADKAFTVKNAKGKVSYKKAKGNGKITVASSGKVTVKKGLKKGKTYKVSVKVTSAATAKYAKVTKKVVLRVKVS